MKCLLKVFALIHLSIGLASSLSFGQVTTGGKYAVEQSNISGGSESSIGNLSVSSSVGQYAAGKRLANSYYEVQTGFWGAPFLAPTSAIVSISGHVRTSAGRGLTNAVVTITDANGASKNAITNASGYYNLEGIEAGGVYLMSVSSRKYSFQSQCIQVDEVLTDFDFVGEPLGKQTL